MGREFFITDVFHHGAFSGNQLATVVDAEGLSGEEMELITREFDFSETTFLMGGDSARGFDVRIFGPHGEMPFAGHPTLGTAFLIREHVEKLDTDLVELNLGIGKIPVSFGEDGVLWMKQRSPEFGGTLSREETAQGLGLSLSDLDADYPPQLVSTGVEFRLVPLSSMAALKRVVVHRASDGAFAFCRGGYDDGQSIAARNVWVGSRGSREDPATGSAAGCLASYLVEHRYMDSDDIDIRMGQGYEVDRPSTLHMRASKGAGGYDIRVGGRVRLVARGELFV